MEDLGSGAHLPLGSRSRLDIDYDVEWRLVISRAPDERAQMHLMSYLLSTCEGMSNREIIDDGAA